MNYLIIILLDDKYQDDSIEFATFTRRNKSGKKFIICDDNDDDD